jgi:hypothetical protein
MIGRGIFMNDFTKEELQEIGKIIWAYDGNRDDGYSMGLLKKIKDIINNYCEHEWELVFSTAGRGVKCLKCEKELE